MNDGLLFMAWTVRVSESCYKIQYLNCLNWARSARRLKAWTASTEHVMHATKLRTASTEQVLPQLIIFIIFIIIIVIKAGRVLDTLSVRRPQSHNNNPQKERKEMEKSRQKESEQHRPIKKTLALLLKSACPTPSNAHQDRSTELQRGELLQLSFQPQDSWPELSQLSGSCPKTRAWTVPNRSVNTRANILSPASRLRAWTIPTDWTGLAPRLRAWTVPAERESYPHQNKAVADGRSFHCKKRRIKNAAQFACAHCKNEVWDFIIFINDSDVFINVGVKAAK